MHRHIIDLFAGPGGWSEGLRRLGHSDTGIELDAAACATRAAAGHRTIRADVADYPTAPLVGKVSGLIGSPPCQTFSAAGLQAGTNDIALCHQTLDDLAAGHDTRAVLRAACTDPRSLLVVEPLRFALDTRPDWIALEEVPAVEPLFAHTARILRAAGYSTWVGVLNAADHGVPQTRRRAFLLASTTRHVEPPTPTHAKTAEQPTLFGQGRAAWVTMAVALGWDATDSAVPAVELRNGNQPRAAIRSIHEPAPTMAFGHNSARVEWVHSRPATTVCTTGRIAKPGHRDRSPAGEPQFTDAVRITVEEAAVLQSFPADYPWRGTKTKRFEQIGNAVPPSLATAVLGTVLEPITVALEVAA